MLTEKQKQDIKNQDAKTLSQKLWRLLQDKKISKEFFFEANDYWFECRDYIKTDHGWLTQEQINDMGLEKRYGRWVIVRKAVVKEEVIGVGRKQKRVTVEQLLSPDVKKEPRVVLPPDKRTDVNELKKNIEEIFNEKKIA